MFKTSWFISFSFDIQVIQAKLEEAESDIAEAKTELEAARLVRRNRMEYDSMAKSIAAYPSRQVVFFALTLKQVILNISFCSQG